ncbi:MAG: hypothetical protein ACAH83_17340 [Alphaproteobacteria bacterium]
MKAAYLALGAAGVFAIFAACYSWAGNAPQLARAPVPEEISSGDTLAIAFVDGAEAEPPAMPEGLSMPEPQTASSTAAADKVAKYPTPEDIKKHLPIRRVSAKAVADAVADPINALAGLSAPPKPVFARPAFHYNE